MNLVFYGYTFKKQVKSVSTYITGFIALIPVWLVTILYLRPGGTADSAESMASIIAYLTFPISMIFMSFKISQIFRDEIENKTILSIQSKPITRKSLIVQAILVIITWSVILATLCGFVPFMLLAIKFSNDRLVLDGVLITLTAVLLLVMIGILGLWLSLSMSGKAFVGTMIGGFVVGFYVLFAVSSIISALSSRDKRLDNLITETRQSAGKYASLNANELNGIPIWNDADTDKILVSAPNEIYASGSPITEEQRRKLMQDSISSLKSFQTDLTNVNKPSVYTVFAWIAPSSQWARMFAATQKASASQSIYGSRSLMDQLSSETVTKDIADIHYYKIETKQDPNSPTSNPVNKPYYVEIQKFDPATATEADMLEVKYIGFTFKKETKQTPPVWFPYLVWIAIGGITIPLMIRSLQRKNIA